MHGGDGLRQDVYTLRTECEMRWGKLSVIVLIFRMVSAIFKNYPSRWYLARYFRLPGIQAPSGTARFPTPGSILIKARPPHGRCP